ncbi:hypothetical protein [Sphingomonas sp. LM7]|uniref:hypothetical protein n=1 Tax=Sphingomonas sp. LM7 TaxID=1938607 RepID=UPI000983997E|nr:hypothetical protein [Sphingomonas sp. LM7]AQR72491.1 hypothetical protein BXU08_01340 [Sphingomonas sp. LM7]
MTERILRLTSIRRWLALLAATLVLAACTPIIAGYSLQAYTNATQLKAETLALIAISGEPWADHAAEARALQTRLDGAYEFSAGTAYNQEATAMWAIIRDRSQDALLGSFFVRWSKGPTGEAYRTRKLRRIRLAFDRLICLEANKKEKTACPAMNPDAADAATETGNE